MLEKLTDLFHCLWRKEAILQELKMHALSTSTNGKEIHKYMIIIGASFYCQLLEIYLPESCRVL